eukprot:1346262-Pleurochrysis_carterae.AAC.1
MMTNYIKVVLTELHCHLHRVLEFGTGEGEFSQKLGHQKPLKGVVCLPPREEHSVYCFPAAPAAESPEVAVEMPESAAFAERPALLAAAAAETAPAAELLAAVPPAAAEMPETPPAAETPAALAAAETLLAAVPPAAAETPETPAAAEMPENPAAAGMPETPAVAELLVALDAAQTAPAVVLLPAAETMVAALFAAESADPKTLLQQHQCQGQTVQNGRLRQPSLGQHQFLLEMHPAASSEASFLVPHD